jgi:MFS family permease
MSHAKFLGWRVLAACVVGLACGIATAVVSTFGVFIGPLREAFGWSQSEAFAALLVITLTSAPLAPVVGGLVDRYGARRVVLLAFAFEALIFASFAWQSASLWTFYARFVAFALFALATTHVAFARVITLWFDRRRGLALGIALSGVGIGGFLWPLFAQAMIEQYGWRNAYLLLAVAIAAIAMPTIALLLRDSPESVGQRADGDPTPEPTPESTAAAPVAAASLPGLTLAEAVRTRAYWMVLGTFFLVGLAVQSVMLHLVPLLGARGLSPMLAALAQSMLFLAVTSGRLVTGWLMDRFFAPRVALAFLLAALCGVALLAFGAAGPTAFVAAMLVGLAVGAEVDVIAYVTSRYFGPLSFSRIYGTFYGSYSLSGGIGPLLTAESVDRTGDYQFALGMHAALLVAGCLLLLKFERFPDWHRGPGRGVGTS